MPKPLPPIIHLNGHERTQRRKAVAMGREIRNAERRGYRKGRDAGLEVAARIVCPRPHVEEARCCGEIAQQIRDKKRRGTANAR